MEIKQVAVKESGRETVLFIPQDEKDKSYNDYLMVAEVEKTREKMKTLPPKEKPQYSPGELKSILTEVREFKKRQKTEHPRKYW